MFAAAGSEPLGGAEAAVGEPVAAAWFGVLLQSVSPIAAPSRKETNPYRTIVFTTTMQAFRMPHYTEAPMDFHPVEENLRQSFRVLAAGRPRCDVIELPGVSIASLGVAFQMFNAA